MSTGHVEYASLNGTHIFKLIGEVRAQSCISLDKLLNKIEQQQNVVGAIVDFCTFTGSIDTTGVLSSGIGGGWLSASVQKGTIHAIVTGV